MTFAFWLNRKLLVETVEGPSLPGAGEARRWVEADGQEFTAITRGDHVDLYFGRGRIITQVAVTTKTAAELGRWLCRWYARRLWYGLKLRLWYWSLDRILSENDADE